MAAPRISTVVINTTDASALASFWAELLEVTVPGDSAGASMIRLPTDATSGVILALQQVDSVDGHSQTHLDIEVDDLDLAQQSIESAAGTLVQTNRTASGFEWRICADPHGNEFCIFARH